MMRLDDHFGPWRVMRVDGGVVCKGCGLAYCDHPMCGRLLNFDGSPCLRVSCDGDRLQLR